MIDDDDDDDDIVIENQIDKMNKDYDDNIDPNTMITAYSEQ